MRWTIILNFCYRLARSRNCEMHQIFFNNSWRYATPITENEGFSAQNVLPDLFSQAYPGLDRFLIYFPWDRADIYTNYYSWCSETGMVRPSTLNAHFSSRNVVNASLMMYALLHLRNFSVVSAIRKLFFTTPRTIEIRSKGKVACASVMILYFRLII